VDDLLGFLTSKTGVFAGVAALVTLLGGVVGIARPWWQGRQSRQAELASVRITSPHLSELSRSSNAYELRFEIANVGGRPAVAIAVRLVVLSRSPSTVMVPTHTEAPLRVNQHRVKLVPGRSTYDVRARAYGPSLPPLSLGEAEVEAFLVKLVADEAQRYEAVIEVDWYDAKAPEDVRTARSSSLEIDFPPRESCGPARP
jgi:hypothetical protein